MDPVTITALVGLAVKYGPEAVEGIIDLYDKKTNPTIAEVRAAFAKLKTYEEYGIPDVAPTVPPVP